MNITQSFRQTIEEARSNPGFTALYVGGVAFAVAFTMVFAIIYYVRLAPVYPEYNRDTTVYIKGVSVRNDATSSMSTGSVGFSFVDECLSNLKNYEYYTVKTSYPEGRFIQPIDGSSDFPALVKEIDPNFFRLYDYEFIAGKPISQSEYESALNVVVVTEDVANRVFGSAETAVGKNLSLNYIDNRIVGVVKLGSSIFPESFGQVFRPNKASYIESRTSGNNRTQRFLGTNSIAIKLKDPRQKEALKTELEDMVRKINAADTTGWTLKVSEFVDNAELVFKKDGEETDFMAILKPYLTLLLVLLIIPAINISGMIGGQMDRRMAELGLRRSFGANKPELCRQVMFENLLLTLFGGIIGLIVAWVIIYLYKGMILGLIGNSWEYLGDFAEPAVTGEMLFAPAVFIGTLLICVVLNILSAYIPVRFALRRPIVSSINSKK